MMKSWRQVVVLYTDHGFSVQMHNLFACIMFALIMMRLLAHSLRFVAFASGGSPTESNTGLCPTIGMILCCLWAPPRQPRFVGRLRATPALTAVLCSDVPKNN